MMRHDALLWISLANVPPFLVAVFTGHPVIEVVTGVIGIGCIVLAKKVRTHG